MRRDLATTLHVLWQVRLVSDQHAGEVTLQKAGTGADNLKETGTPHASVNCRSLLCLKVADQGRMTGEI